MAQWWDSLSALQRVFGYIALPATFLLIIQSLLILFGIGDGDVDVDTDVDADIGGGHAHLGAGDGFALFSVRGLVAFFSVGGWVGIVLDGAGLHAALTITLSFLAGAVALVGVAFLFRMASRLQSSGNLELINAVGKSAKVYIPIPASEGGTGKVTLNLQERFVECDALTRAGRGLKTGEHVRVVAVVGQNTLVVEPESVSVSVEESKAPSVEQSV